MEILKILGLMNNLRKHIIMPEWNTNQEFRLKKIDKTINYLTEEINPVN